MFPWNIAKSAEAMFSRWAVRRFCKFLLKKKLGQFLLGDIDLEQLDIQLSDGTIKLSDVALNVDYLNSKISTAASIIIKEGSIGSLLIKMPWKGKGCQVEVEDIELVLAPCTVDNFPAGAESLSSALDGGEGFAQDLGKLDHDMVDVAAKLNSMDVHEGVKTIAKMVRWILTSFHVKVNNLIVAFDPCTERDEKIPVCRKILVLRISEMECGTCLSDYADPNSKAKVESLLGISTLTNFVQFRGVILELLQSDDIDKKTCSSGVSGTMPGEFFSLSHTSSVTTPIIIGKKGGFCGTLNLSMPWRDGSLDIRKVDADIFVELVELRCQPSTIVFLIDLWDTIRSVEDGGGHMLQKLTDHANCSSIPVSGAIAMSEVIPDHGFSNTLPSLMLPESANEALLPGSHFISDWVPSSAGKSNKVGTDKELDFGASVDQFFECFDGMRSCQSALGNSGMWKWTCSVFSAITAASSLASGSLHISNEQQHVETNLKATFAGLSVGLSFEDEIQTYLCGSEGDKINAGSYIPYLSAECQDICLTVQVSPCEMRFGGTIKHIEVTNYLTYIDDCLNSGLMGCNGKVNSQNYLIQHLQADVQSALPPFASSVVCSEKFSGSIAKDFPFGNKDNVMKVTLLKTSGVTCGQFTLKSSSTDGSLMQPTSFSVKFPSFVLWLDLPFLNMLLKLSKEVGKPIEEQDASYSNASNVQFGTTPVDLQRHSSPCVTTLSPSESLQGNIFVPNARIILCFPNKSGKDISDFSSRDRFLSLDFSSLTTGDGEMIHDTGPRSCVNSGERYLSTGMQALHLNVGNLDIFLVTPAMEGFVANSSSVLRPKFSAEKFFSLISRISSYSVISFFLQEGHITGPWVAKRAKFLATFEESKSCHNFVGEGYEFVSVSTIKELEDFKSRTVEEMTFSSVFFVHVHLSSVTIKLGHSQYESLSILLDQMTKELSFVAYDEINVKEETSMSQISFFLNCDAVEILISPDVKDNIKSSIQIELPGSWYCLRLQVEKFTLLSTFNVGGIKGGSFFWIAHSEGKLWGSITSAPNQEFLLISCSNSTMKRGDGGGSNALSSRLAGFDTIYFWEPEISHGFTSVTVKGGTVVGVGGRLDWIDAITSFFSVPCGENEHAAENCSQKRDSDMPFRASFILNLVDVGLSYEPYMKNLVVKSGTLDSEFEFSNVKEEKSIDQVACLLAASSLTLSNSCFRGAVKKEYRIRVEDLGILLRTVSGIEDVGCSYNTKYLRKVGYVKIAQEALVEAILRTNYENGILWEVDCPKSHIYMETCSNTTYSIIRLAAQLQKLFAPDIEESVVHLETRWIKAQEEHERKGLKEDNSLFYNDTEASSSCVRSSHVATQSEPEVVGILNEIREDAFHVDGDQMCQYDCSESQVHNLLDESCSGEGGCLSIGSHDSLSPGLSFDGSVPVAGLERSHISALKEDNILELLEGYCLPELRPLSEPPIARQPLNDFHVCNSSNVITDLEWENSGWYPDTTFKIVEDHISKKGDSTCTHKLYPTNSDSIKVSGFTGPTGCVFLKNIDVRWRMYAGVDSHKCQDSCQESADTSGRDTSTCLELSLSGMEIQYEMFPVGGLHVSRLSLAVQDFHLYDRSRDAPWTLVLGDYHSKDHPRRSSSKAFKMELEAVRPDPLTPLEEYRLHIACLPILLHLHQSQLDFLISFFGWNDSSVDQSPGHYENPDMSKLSVMGNNLAGHTIKEEAFLPYFQNFDIWPVFIRVDYIPRCVDLAALRGGKYAELVNLVPWKGVELQLKHVHAAGIYGWGNVCETIAGEWLEDISQNQIHKILRGLPTVRSLVAVAAGAAKLVSMPVENYRKDKRVLKGMQRGTAAFLRSISLETVALGVHLAAGAHDILLQAEYVCTTIAPSVPLSIPSRNKGKVRSNQPKDAQQGIQRAYETLSDGLGKSASALVQTPLKRYQRGASAGSAFATAVRAVPAAAVAPVSACASAVHCAFLGFRNSLDPERKKESIEKYMGPSEPWEQN